MTKSAQLRVLGDVTPFCHGFFVFTLLAAPAHAQRPNSFIGLASCATTTCHGNVVGRGPIWNHSLSLFLKDNPHAGAGHLLRRDANPLSKAIVGTLDPEARTSDEAYQAVLQSRCISCHATVTPEQCDPGAESLDSRTLDVGVSCESCHGPANDWLDAHVATSWTNDRKSDSTAMRDMKSIVGRAETCVRCHVGSRSQDGLDRDMNHDLIAAGHPALRFDLLIYNENLPKHWDLESESEKKFLASAVQLREVSRAVNLAAAASLASERAADHLNARGARIPWPEFSDYDCFACHQSLSIERFDVELIGQKRSPLRISDGLPIWNTWHTTGQLDLRDSSNILKALSPHRSNPTQMATSGQSLAQRFRNLALETANQQPPGATQSLAAFRESLAKSQLDDWHDCAIAYLKLDAISRDLASSRATEEQALKLRAKLPLLEERLRFERTPTENNGSRPRRHSPKGFDPQSFRESMLTTLTPES